MNEHKASTTDPRIIAWESYKKSYEYSRNQQWVEHPEYRDGAIWGTFVAGYEAGRHAAAAPAPSGDQEQQ